MPTQDGLSIEGHRTAALFILMGVCWATEAVPVAVTELIPLALFPIFGISDVQFVDDLISLRVFCTILVITSDENSSTKFEILVFISIELTLGICLSFSCILNKLL